MSTQVQKQARGSSWRDIQQRKRTGGKAATKAAKRRRLQLLFRGFLVLFIGVALVAGFLALRYFGSQLADAQPVLAETPIQLDFRSDGVLTEDWTRRILGSQLDQPVREIDVLAVKRLLEEQGQVSLASVSVVLPGTLRITLEEREPVLRVRVRPQSGPPETLLVARDGTLSGARIIPRTPCASCPVPPVCASACRTVATNSCADWRKWPTSLKRPARPSRRSTGTGGWWTSATGIRRPPTGHLWSA